MPRSGAWDEVKCPSKGHTVSLAFTVLSVWSTERYRRIYSVTFEGILVSPHKQNVHIHTIPTCLVCHFRKKVRVPPRDIFLISKVMRRGKISRFLVLSIGLFVFCSIIYAALYTNVFANKFTIRRNERESFIKIVHVLLVQNSGTN